MGFSYLKGKSWLDVTREERLFCSYLYHDIVGKETEFVTWLNTQPGAKALDLPIQDDWEIGYEVCLYRDFLKVIKNEPVNTSAFSPKRTFNLCLFSEKTIVVFEAKVQQGFDQDQISEFAKDKKKIAELLERPLVIKLVAIVSTQYVQNLKKFGKIDLSSTFDAIITWEQVFKQYRRDLYLQADKTYKS